ncbi:MAG: peptidase [Candidatus Krumholzibacteriaceae bacterium]
MEMIRGLVIIGMAILAFAAVSGCGAKKEKIAIEPAADAGDRLKVYAPYDIEVPWALIGEQNKPALQKIYEACQVMDELFLRQVWSRNVELRDELARRGNPELLHFFWRNFGPWDRLDGDKPVLVKDAKSAGAGFYPPDMTKEEFENWIKNHPQEKTAFESSFTVITRTKDKGLEAVPYSKEYAELLTKAAGLLDEAAALVDNASLADFLKLRAKAFLSDDYYASDMAWMDIKDNVIDLTIGPYEVYEDNLFNYKAAFEAFLCVRDPEETKKLDGLKGYLAKMEQNLPIEQQYKNTSRGMESPISVVDEIFNAGDSKRGVQTIAFNLPNDEKVRAAKGSKKVMLRNICKAKFEKILVPIARQVLAPADTALVTFDAYFDHTILHEFSHGLGPGILKLPDGSETTVNKALREQYSGIEEAKADIVGEHNIYYLVGEGFFPEALAKETAVTYLVGFFRAVRFGAGDAHGKAVMAIFNYLKEKGAYVRDPATGLWSVDFKKIKGAVEACAHDILMLEARGDYAGTKAFMEKYGTMDPAVKTQVDNFKGIPVDIEPRFVLESAFGGTLK